MAFGDFGVLILGLLGDFLLLWAILATVGLVWMFFRMPNLIYGLINELLTERGFPRTQSKGGRPKEGVAGQIAGVLIDRFANPPPAGAVSAPEPAVPYYPSR